MKVTKKQKDMCESFIEIALPLKFRCKLLFYLIILLVTCPVLGQVNKSIETQLEGERLFFKIDVEALQKPMLFVRHDVGYHQVIWSKHLDHIILTIPQIESLSGVVIPLNYDYHDEANIIGRFPILKDKSSNKSFYIDVTDLFLNTAIKWNLESPEHVLLNQSYIDRVQYLENETVILTKRTTSYKNNQKTSAVNFSFYLLPEPMVPRLFDHRMGFKNEDEFGIISAYPKTAKASIMRWRLEKKIKDEHLSEPIKPIVFYFDPDMPNKWKPYIKAGIMEWLPAFEAAGFKNAIEVKDPPVHDSTWCSNSINYSIIRWANYTDIRGSENKGGSTVNNIVDFRSGEILKSDIIIGSSYQALSDIYLIRCAPLDKRAQQYPFPDDLMGELLQSLTAHEAGHAFGIKDANYGEYAYPFEKMRDKKWLQSMGHTPSIMSYARHNYIVQPEDSIPPSLLIQKVGPADAYQIKWGYQIFDDIINQNEALLKLEKLVQLQDSISWYRYNNDYFKTIGPGCTNEVVENNDPVKSTELGLKNIKRVIGLLPKINQNQKDNAFLERLHNKTLELWYHQMKQVISLIGGYTIQYKSGTQSGAVYTPIPYDIQVEALEFLLENAFEVPEWLSNPSYSSRIQYSTDSNKLMEYQLKLLSELIEPYRMKRLEEMENNSTYKGIIRSLLIKLRTGLFNKLQRNEIFLINQRKQELQRAYLDIFIRAINQEKNYTNIRLSESNGFYNGFSKSLLISELLFLQEDITVSLEWVEDKITLAHLTFCLTEIKRLSKKQ
tara:strand:- start:39282 stop:41615 length:2334 start_codon:yes stop_codon:yes gene_type:complete